MVISHNLTAMNANRMLGIDTWNLTSTTEKLSSGYAINRAADNAAGLSISEKMRKQIRGLDQGAENIMDGISMLQVADGALTEVHDMLQRMNQLSVQAANGTNSSSDRADLQSEVDALVTEIDRIGKTTSFNEIKLFQGKNDKNTAAGNHSAERSVFVKGKPADTSITSYQISADAAGGITVNGTTYGWADIKNGNGDSLADGITDDTYTFTFNGLTVEIGVSSSDTLDKIATDMDGLTFSTNPTTNKVSSVAMGKTSAISLFYVFDHYTYVDLNHSGTCKISADQAGITITNMVTNASTYLDFGDTGYGYHKSYDELMQEGTLNSLTFDFFDTQYAFTLGLNAGWTKDDVINALNGCTYETSFTGNVEDYSTSLADMGTISMCGFSCNFSKDFYLANGCDLEKLNIENLFVGSFIQDPANAYNYTVKLEKDGYINTFMLDVAGQNRLNEINTNGWHAGEEVRITFHDGDGNSIEVALKTSSDLNYSNLTYYLANRQFFNQGHSIYDASNFVRASDKDYDIDLSKKNSTSGGKESVKGHEIRIQCSGSARDHLMVKIGTMDSKTIGVNGLSVRTEMQATNSIDTIASAISKISEQRARIGAQQNRLEHAYDINQNTSENTQYAESEIRDADMASLMVLHAGNSILLQAAQSMLAQANQSNQYVMNILS